MFVIDASPSMGEMRTVEVAPGPDGEPRSIEMTRLQWSVQYVKLKVQQMIHRGLKTEKCGVVVIGSEDTANPVSDEHGGYDNVTLLMPVHPPNARTLMVIDNIEPSTVIGDFLDGVIVASYVQNQDIGTKKWTRKMTILTDGESPLEVEEDDLQTTIDKLNEWNVDVTVVGVDFDDAEAEEPFAEEDKSDIKRANERIYHSFVAQLEQGTVGNTAHALSIARSPEAKGTKSTLSRTVLNIGDVENSPEDSISFAVQVAKATAICQPVSLKKFTKRKPKEGEGADVESQAQAQAQAQAQVVASQSQSQSRALASQLHSQIQSQLQSQSQSLRQDSKPTHSHSPTDASFPIILAAHDVVGLEQRTEFVLEADLREAEERAANASAAGAKEGESTGKKKKNGGLDDSDVEDETPAQAQAEPEASTSTSHPKAAAPSANGTAKAKPEIPVIDDESLVRAYKYGTSWVPIDNDAADVDKFPSVQGVEVVGFCYESSFKRDWSMGEVYCIFGEKETPKAQVALSALVRAMLGFTRKKSKNDEDEEEEEESVPLLAILRIVSSVGAEPKIGIAMPRSTEGVDYLVWVRMPFAEDLRRFVFPSLDILKDKSGRQKKTHALLPTKEMQDAMDELVENCDLGSAGEKDADGNRLPWYTPQEAFHPAIHRTKEALFHAAITKNIEADPIPPPHPLIVKFFDRPKKFSTKTRTKNAIEACKSAFNVTEVPRRTAFRKRKATDAPLASDANVPLSLSALLGGSGDAYISTLADWEEPSTPRKGDGKQSVLGEGKIMDSPSKMGESQQVGMGDGSPSRKRRKMSRPEPKPKASRDDDEGSSTDNDEDEEDDEDDENEMKMDVDSPSHPTASSSSPPKPKPHPKPTTSANRIIGTIHPLADLEQNIARGDVISKSVKDMGDVIIEIVDESFGSQRFEEAIECMRAMRKVAVDLDEVDEYNAFLHRLKITSHSPNFKNPQFWEEKVQPIGVAISLIHDGEAESDISLRGSKRFIQA